MDASEHEVLGIIQSLESYADRSPTWRMVYRRFSGDDFILKEILAKLLAQGKISEAIVANNAEYRTKH